MGLHHQMPCQLRALDAEGIVTVSGAPGYVASPTPPAHATYSLNISNDTIRCPFEIDGAVEDLPSAGTAYEFAFTFQNTVNSTANDTMRLGVGRSGTQGITVGTEDTTNHVTLYVANTLVATSTHPISLATWTSIQVEVDHQAGGDVVVYVDGDRSSPVITYTLLAGDITNLTGLPNEWFAKGHTIGTYLIDMIALDSGDTIAPTSFATVNNPRCVVYVPTSAGTYADMTGAYTDVDELPYSDSDYVEATAAAQQQTFGHAASTAGRIGGVMLYARVVRGDATAGTQMRFLADDGTVGASAAQGAPGAGHTFGRFKQRRNGTDFGDPTAANDFNATDYGVESVA